MLAQQLHKIESLQYVLKYTGRYNTPEEYGNIALRADASGEVLRLKDVAEIEFGTTYFDVEAKLNGKPCAAIALKQLPGSNASEVIKNIKKRLEELKATTFLKGMDYEVSYDVSRFLDASVHEVLRTLIEAFLLVSLVVFIFLQDWRSTLIPALAVPVSLVGTFLFMQLFGFSLNLITLFAMVLAIGIVVDNAIVVVEAVHAKMEKSNIRPKKATIEAMNEISGAILAITLVMSAVFVPVAFLSGPTGIFGSFLFLKMMGLENNIYAQISLIMLIGLLGKNAILIVEFATMRHREGRTAVQAAIEGAAERLRPILMTSFAFVAGLIPLMLASGAGAVGNRTLGAASAGGMVFGTIFGVIVIPGLYVIFAKIAERFLDKEEEEPKAYTETF
jgi:multidrug efflux pump subunit AcrB